MFKEHFMFVYQGFLECFISAIIVEKPHCLKTRGQFHQRQCKCFKCQILGSCNLSKKKNTFGFVTSVYEVV